MKKRSSILTLVVLVGFGVFLKSRWDEVARVDATNHKLEARIAEKWREAVARREVAAQATAARKDRFQLRNLAAILIDARVSSHDLDPEEMTRQRERLSRLPVDGLTGVIDEFQAASFPDDARIKIETMLTTELVARCTLEPGHDALIHRFLMNSPVPPDPETARPLVALISDSQLRTEVAQRLEISTSP